MSTVQVRSVKELIEELGGPAAAARAFGTSPQNVVHWQNNDRIPAKFYPDHVATLSARKLHAPISLWGFVQRAAS